MTITNYTLNIDTFPLSKKYVSTNDLQKLSQINVQETIIEEYYEQQFNNKLKYILFSLLENNKIYLTYVENFVSEKNKVRTYRKMFYQYKKNISKKNLFELEIDINLNQSILTAIIKLDKKNIDFCLDELINSNFTFGFIVPKGNRSFKKSRSYFLNQLIENRLEERKAIETNFLKSLSKNLNKNKSIFTIHRTENKEFLRFFSTNKNGVDCVCNKL